MRRPVTAIVGRLARRREPDGDLWEARQRDLAVRRIVQQWWVDACGPTPEEADALLGKLIDQMQAEHLARQWAHRIPLAVQIELREEVDSFFERLFEGLPDGVAR